jgi:hypothetical protein
MMDVADGSRQQVVSDDNDNGPGIWLGLWAVVCCQLSVVVVVLVIIDNHGCFIVDT